jgi:acetolactate synthase-1/2/3 large subunit
VTTISAGQAIIEVLKAEGIRFVFGVPGGHTIGIYDALYDAPEIRYVLVRHEQHAACLAAGHAQLTGEPSVVCVTAGPGATNLVTAVAEAFVGALPMIILAGRGATRNALRGASQEIDQVTIFTPLTKWAVRVDRPDLIVESLRQAFVISRSGKPGPVLLDIPQDVLASQVEFSGYKPVGAPARLRGNADRIRAAARSVARAERPLIVSGGGAIASGAAAEVVALAERLAIPVITTLAGRGIVSDDHVLMAGGLGHHRTAITKKLLPEADVVIGIGARFEQQETNWQPSYLPDPKATYIQIDTDPDEIGKSVVADIGIVGDAKSVVAELLAALDAENAARPRSLVDVPRVRELATMRAALEAEADDMAASTRRPIHPMRVIRAARSVFPKDSTVAIDVGVLAQAMAGAFPYFKIYGARRTIVPSSFYGMGFAAAAAPVARLVRPDQAAVCFVGDGSFNMVMNIMPFAAEQKLPVTWCILDDEALGSIRDIQETYFNGRYIGTEFSLQPDFAKMAEACGCHGEKVEDPGQVDAALGRAKAANEAGRPAVLDFIVARERLAASVEFFAR